IWHNQPIEPKHYAGIPFDPAGHVDCSDMAVDARIAVFALVNHSRAERVTDFGIDTGQGVIEPNPEGYMVWNGEALLRTERGNGRNHDQGQSRTQACSGVYESDFLKTTNHRRYSFTDQNE